MPLVEVTLAEGRTPAQIRALIHELHEAVVRAIDAAPSSVRVIVREVPTAHWAAGDVTLAERRGRGPAPLVHDRLVACPRTTETPLTRPPIRGVQPRPAFSLLRGNDVVVGAEQVTGIVLGLDPAELAYFSGPPSASTTRSISSKFSMLR